MRPAPAVNRTRHVGSVTCARYHYAMWLTILFTVYPKMVLLAYSVIAVLQCWMMTGFLVVIFVVPRI